MRANCSVKPIPNSMLNMLLNFPEKSISRRPSAIWSTWPGQRCEPSASAKKELLKPGMFMMRMPISAKPRTMSSTGLRSLAGTEVGVDVTIGGTLGQDPRTE